MKKHYFTILIAVIFAFLGHSQTIPPPYINYQAVLYEYIEFKERGTLKE